MLVPATMDVRLLDKTSELAPLDFCQRRDLTLQDAAMFLSLSV